MPNWKKLIVSGSDATLSNLNVVNNVDASTFSGDGSNLTFTGTNLVSGSSQVVSSLSNQDIDLGTGDITATTGSFDVIDLDRLALTSTQTTVSPLHLTATNLNDGVGALRIDGAQADIYLNPTTSTHTTVTFAVGGSPKLAFGMDSSDDFYITRNDGTSWYDDTLVLDRNTGEVTLGYDLTVNGNINATNGIISGSSQLTSSFDSRYLNVSGEGTISGSFSGSFAGDGSGLTNLNTEVSQVATVTSSFEDVSTISVIHSFDSKNVIVSVYGTDYSQIIPQSVTLTDNDTVDIVLSSNHSGHVVVAKGGHIIASSDLDSYRLDVSGTSSYAVSHSLAEEYPFVQAWNTDSNQMEQPLSVESTSANSLTVEFSGNFVGKIIVKK